MTPEIKQRVEKIRRGEVPEGYKKTKVGVVPSEWEITKLSSISSHVTKKNTDGNIQTTFTNSATQGVIKQTDYFDKEISNRENITGYYVVQENDYIYNPRISASAPCGPINKSHFVDEGVVSPLYTVFKMTNDLQKNQYIEYYLKSPFWHRYMCGVANYGARHDRMNITNEDLFAMPIPFPTLAEQEKIAEILSAQDKLIALKEKLIEEKMKQKKHLMQRLLHGDGWKKRKLSELAEIDTGGADTQDKKENGAYPFFVRSATIEKIDSYTYNGEAILIPGDGKIGEIFHYYVGKFNYHQRVYKISSFRDCIGKFIYYYLQLFFKKRAYTMTAKATVDSLRMEMLSDMPISLPNLKQQQKITAVLSAADSEIQILQTELDQEKQKKKALMQLLLTGIVRL